MPIKIDGPQSPLFTPLSILGNVSLNEIASSGVSKLMADSASLAPCGEGVCWGMPFSMSNPVLVKDKAVTIEIDSVKAKWLVFSHVTDLSESNSKQNKFVQIAGRKVPLLGFMGSDHAGDYVFLYEDGSELRCSMGVGREIAPFATRMDENCYVAVSDVKCMTTRWGDNELVRNQFWGRAQQQNFKPDLLRSWTNWLWSWENPHPDKAIIGVRIEPVESTVLLFGISAGNVSSVPTRWLRRRKCIFQLGEAEIFNPSAATHNTQGVMLDEVIAGSRYLNVDMGQIISVQPRTIYPNDRWAETKNNDLPEESTRELLVEYSCHPDAHFHLSDGRVLSARELSEQKNSNGMVTLPPAERKIRFSVVDKTTGRLLAAKIHLHGESGEYLTPVNRPRNPNPHWFQEYGADYVHKLKHFCTYIDGEVEIFLPEGKVYIEVSKGFEIAPVRLVKTVDEQTELITVELENVLNWRRIGWVTADTHVHFLSPQTALIEGAAEGVNIVNLLASQWGEIFSNVGDFDGRTTFGERSSHSDGEYLVRVGTENRQSVLGHISLLGYQGDMITPLATGGPSESAIGDPVEALLTDWAKRCKAQNGTVVIPHFPLPRAEHAATIVAGLADAVELTALAPIARGSLNAYDLADWYRYLNCGYFVAAVGGTDKMSASTAVGAGRTYACLREGEALSYESWQQAVSRGHTFVTLGPLLDFSVEGNPPGTRMQLPSSGGTVDITWRAESVVIPMTRVELIVNGEVRESEAINSASAAGNWQLKLAKSSWVAILIRGCEPGLEEVISAHSSPIMIAVDSTEFMVASDALSILEQIEGSLAYLDVIGTRTDIETYRKMRLTLTSVHRTLHARMHAKGVYHKHNAVTHHDEHDKPHSH